MKSNLNQVQATALNTLEVNEPDTKKLSEWQMFVKLFFATLRESGRQTGATMTDCAEAYRLMKQQVSDDEVCGHVEFEPVYGMTPEDILIALESEDEDALESAEMDVIVTVDAPLAPEDNLFLLSDEEWDAMVVEDRLHTSGYFAPWVPVETKPTTPFFRRPVDGLAIPTTLDELEAFPATIDEMEAKLDTGTKQPWTVEASDRKFSYAHEHAQRNQSRLRKLGKLQDRTTVRHD